MYHSVCSIHVCRIQTYCIYECNATLLLLLLPLLHYMHVQIAILLSVIRTDTLVILFHSQNCSLEP